MARDKKRSPRAQKRVLTIVGEGPTEKAFVEHIRQFYGNGNLSVRVKSADGKGPNNVINDAIGTLKASSKGVIVAALLDKDLPWPRSLVQEAQRSGITLVGVDPCIEGLLIDILKHKRPNPCNNNTCKKYLHPKLSGNPTNKKSYVELYTHDVLEDSRKSVQELEQIISLFFL